MEQDIFWLIVMVIFLCAYSWKRHIDFKSEQNRRRAQIELAKTLKEAQIEMSTRMAEMILRVYQQKNNL